MAVGGALRGPDHRRSGEPGGPAGAVAAHLRNRRTSDPAAIRPRAGRAAVPSQRSDRRRGGARRLPGAGGRFSPALVGLYRLDWKPSGPGMPGEPDSLRGAGVAAGLFSGAGPGATPGGAFLPDPPGAVPGTVRPLPAGCCRGPGGTQQRGRDLLPGALGRLRGPAGPRGRKPPTGPGRAGRRASRGPPPAPGRTSGPAAGPGGRGTGTG